MPTDIVQLFSSELGDREVGHVQADTLRRAGCQHLVLTVSLPCNPEDLDAVHTLLNDPGARRRIIRQALAEAPFYEAGDTPNPVAATRLYEHFVEQSTTQLPAWEWTDLADPGSDTARQFTARSKAYDPEAALRVILQNSPGFAGLIEDWQGPITLVPIFAQRDVCAGLYDVCEGVESMFMALPADFDLEPSQLLSLADLAWRIDFAADVLLLERLVAALQHDHHGLPIGLITEPGLFCVAGAIATRLALHGFEFDSAASDEPACAAQWTAVEYLEAILLQGGLSAIGSYPIGSTHLMSWALAQLYTDEDSTTGQTSEWASNFMALEHAALMELWGRVGDVIAHTRRRLAEMSEEDEAAREALCEAGMNRIVYDLLAPVAEPDVTYDDNGESGDQTEA